MTPDPGFGVYVHIPFCARRCHYCDFNTYEGQEQLIPAYVDALVGEITRWPSRDRAATSVFFGGGTPTLLTAAQLARILDAISEAIGIEPEAEVTIEANPDTVDEPYLREVRGAGFDRISIGVQSTVDRVLLGLGRTHSGPTALDALQAARRAGFDNINADLIYGSPWETEDDWIVSLNDVIEAEPDHVSAYALTVEEGTPLAVRVATGRVPDVDPDIQAARHRVADEMLGEAGFDRYEVSNWSRPGRACRHNLLYWRAGNYAAFGAGAHGHKDGTRWWTVRLPRTYIDRVRSHASTREGEERLTPDQQAGEALMLGLRLKNGVKSSDFLARFGATAWDRRSGILQELHDRGLIVLDDGTVRISPDATMLSNEVLCRVL